MIKLKFFPFAFILIFFYSSSLFHLIFNCIALYFPSNFCSFFISLALFLIRFRFLSYSTFISFHHHSSFHCLLFVFLCLRPSIFYFSFFSFFSLNLFFFRSFILSICLSIDISFLSPVLSLHLIYTFQIYIHRIPYSTLNITINLYSFYK